MERIVHGLQDMSSQMSSLVLNIEKLQKQYEMSSRHTQGFLAANDEDSLGKMIRAYIRQAIRDCKPDSDDILMSHVDAISMDVSADAEDFGLFSSSVRSVESINTVTTVGKGAKSRPRFIRFFRTQKHFYSKVATINVRLNQLRQRCILVPNTLLYFSIEIDIIPRILTRSGLSISFSNVPNDGGYYSLCPSIRPIRVRASDDPIWTILHLDDVDAFAIEYKAGRASASDCHQSDRPNLFEVSYLRCICEQSLIRFFSLFFAVLSLYIHVEMLSFHNRAL